jgi:hypothetical protein
MRNEAILAVLLMLVGGSLGAGYLIGSMQSAAKTGINSTTSTSESSTGSSLETRHPTTIVCTQLESEPLYLTVKHDNGTPIPNQPLTIQAHLLVGSVYNSTTNGCDSILSTHAWTNETGSTGQIELGWTGDVFNITTSYLGRTYHVNADAEGAESPECVTLSLPSGAVNDSFAPLFSSHC